MKYFRNLIRNEYSINITWLLIDKIIRLGLGMFVSLALARYLGPKLFGNLNYLQSLVLLITPFGFLGIDEILVKQLVVESKKKEKLLASASLLRLIGSILSLVILIISGKFLVFDSEDKLIIFILWGASFFQIMNVAELYLQSIVNSKIFAKASTFIFILVSILKIIGIYRNFELIHLVLLITLEQLLIFLTTNYFTFKNYLELRKKKFIASIDDCLKILKESWPLLFSSIFIIVYMKIDQIMLKHLTNQTEVGVYAAAARVSEMWYFIPISITTVLFPAILRSKERSRLEYKENLQKLFTLMTIMSLGLAIFISISAKPVISVLFGNAYSKSSSILKIHIWSGILVFYGTARGKWIIAEGYQKKGLLIHLIGGISNIFFNFILIPRHQGFGAALATFLSHFVSSILFTSFFKEFRTLNRMFLKSFFDLKNIRQLKSKIS